ncbi:MAG: hypothetical protein ACLUE1_02460 [Adlercreutzia equolifaciens]
MPSRLPEGPYAYNNTPSDFTVRDNGSAWVAQAGATRYATLAGAFATAPITAPLSSSAA